MGTASLLAEKLIRSRKKRQGTTSQLEKKLEKLVSFVSAHGFSRAENATK
jgi:hypothetical protein